MTAIERGDGYRRSFPRLAGEKLFLPRDADGNPNTEIFRVADILQRELASQKAFLAVIPTGSMMYGYSNPRGSGQNPEELSDVDFTILYDSSFQANAREKLPEIMHSEEEKYRKAHPDASSWHVAHLFDLNRAVLRQRIADAQIHAVTRGSLMQLLAPLAGPATGAGVITDTTTTTGDRFSEYRTYIRDEFQKWPAEERAKLLDGVVNILIDIERGSYVEDTAGNPIETKRNMRVLQDATGDQIAALEEQRRILWEERVGELFGL